MSPKSSKKNVIKQTSDNGFVNIQSLEGFLFEKNDFYFIDPRGQLKSIKGQLLHQVNGYLTNRTVISDREVPIHYITEDARF